MCEEEQMSEEDVCEEEQLCEEEENIFEEEDMFEEELITGERISHKRNELPFDFLALFSFTSNHDYVVFFS